MLVVLVLDLHFLTYDPLTVRSHLARHETRYEVLSLYESSNSYSNRFLAYLWTELLRFLLLHNLPIARARFDLLFLRQRWILEENVLGSETESASDGLGNFTTAIREVEIERGEG